MTIPPPVFYFLLCLVVGWLGDRSPFGFWGSLLGSIIFTPMLAMAILLFVARKDVVDAEAGAEA